MLLKFEESIVCVYVCVYIYRTTFLMHIHNRKMFQNKNCNLCLVYKCLLPDKGIYDNFSRHATDAGEMFSGNMSQQHYQTCVTVCHV